MRDAGTLVMFAGAPYVHLHICGSPWEVNELSSRRSRRKIFYRELCIFSTGIGFMFGGAPTG
jgi:hypothetical protein